MPAKVPFAVVRYLQYASEAVLNKLLPTLKSAIYQTKQDKRACNSLKIVIMAQTYPLPVTLSHKKTLGTSFETEVHIHSKK